MIIELVWIDGAGTELDTLDLQGGADGLKVAADGWVPAVAFGDTPVIETFTLRVSGANTNGLATALQQLSTWLQRIGWSQNGIDNRVVWLRVQLDAETYARQAALVDLSWSTADDLITATKTTPAQVDQLRCAIKRQPYWEQASPAHFARTAISSTGGIATLGNVDTALAGDVPARLSSLMLYPMTTNSRFDQWWIGLKVEPDALAGTFISVWPLASGSVRNDTTIVTDGTAYNGHSLHCTFASAPTLNERVLCTLRMIKPSGDLGAFRGRYQALLRAKAALGSEIYARLKFGWALPYSFMGSTLYTLRSPIYRPRATVMLPTYGLNAWQLFDLGQFNIPSDRNSTSLDNFSIAIEAERDSPAGTLDLDCLILIPALDGMAAIAGPAITTAEHVTLRTDPFGKLGAFEIEGAYASSYTPPEGNTFDMAEIKTELWGLPVDITYPALKLIAAAQLSTEGHALDQTLNLIGAYVPRWRMLRGAE
jgi:hypothetical protein